MCALFRTSRDDDDQYESGGHRRRINPRLIMALIFAAIAFISYLSKSSTNPITGEVQRVAMTVDQEVALGLQAAPEMAAQHGGPDPSPEDQARVDRVGRQLVSTVGDSLPYTFDFHLLSDPRTVNAFALPGGQVFVTRALYDALDSDELLAGVLAHEIGHVIERHSAQQLAKTELTQGLTGAAVLATYDPYDPSTRRNAAIAALVGQLVTMRFGRTDELESDRWGVKLLRRTGYDPRAMIEVMQILERLGGSGRTPEFFSTHPNPENRIAQIERAIREEE